MPALVAKHAARHEGRSKALATSDNSTRPRITLRLPVELYKRLEELREITYASNVNEVLKNAMLFYDALVKERLKGNDVYVISEDGEKTRYPVFIK